MTPTRCDDEIEGRSYKEYVYSPVPASPSSALCQSTTLQEDPHVVLTNNRERIAGREEFRRIKENRPTENMTETGSTLLQYVAAAAGNLCIVATGAMLGWTSPVLPKLKNGTDDSPLVEQITEEEGSWVGSLVALGAIAGSLAGGYLAERLGRKLALLLTVMPFLFGWVLIGTAKAVVQLYIARLIFGFALGICFTVIPMYVGEIAETSVRGALGSFLQLFITVGLLYSYAIGPFVDYNYFCLACACLPVLFFVCFMGMPESPYYLIAAGQKDKAVESLAKLRSKSTTAVQKEADEIQASVEEAMRSQATVADLFKVKSNRKALMYTCALVAFQQLTGINVVLFYMDDIFQAAQNPLPVPTVIVGVVQLLASGVTPIVVDRLGRRILLLISGVGEIVGLGVLGLYFYLKTTMPQDQIDEIAWIPVTSLVIFIALYCIGWGPLPWAVMGEMFAADVKSKASSVTVCVCWGLAFFITKFASNITDKFGMHITFWGFAVFCILSVLFTVFVLPETKGKSLREIQDELNGVKSTSVGAEGAGSGIKK